MGKLRFRFQAPFTMKTGYGRLACWIARSFLHRRDTDVEIFAHGDKIQDDVPPEVIEAARKPANYRGLGIIFSYPNHLHYLPTNIKVVYTVWETDRLPNEYIRALGEADLILTQSEFCRSLFSSSVDVRVENVGAGVDTDFFTYGDTRDGSVLRIGTCGVMSPRKGIDVLAKAIAHFKGRNDIEFHIKTRDTRWMPDINQSNVFIYDIDWTNEQMRDFYRSIDFFISPSRGEGFGLCPIEAACCGTPGAVTNWSGPRDYIGEYIQPIEWTCLNRPHSGAFRFEHVGKWAEPSLQHLVHVIETMYNNGGPTEEYRRRVSKWARGNYAIDLVTDRIHASLRRIYRER